MTSYLVPPVERAIKLLQYIADGNNCSNASKVAKDIEINRTTLQRLLHTLSVNEMIEELPDGSGYQLGTGLISLASSALHSKDLVQVAQPVLKELAINLGLSAHLGVLHDCDVIYLVRETPNLHMVSNIRVGSRLPAHATTIGRILLCERSDHEVKNLLGTGELEQFSGKTPASLAQLRVQLDMDRQAGIAWSVGNYEEGIGSCAVAVRDAGGCVVGAINVTGPDRQFKPRAGKRQSIEEAIRSAATRLSRQLGLRARNASRVNTVGV